MTEKVSLVVTSIAVPNEALRRLARGCQEHGYDFIVIGDVASPANFQLDGCRFFGLSQQAETDLKLASLLPTKHYARKNLGYLLAHREGAKKILETDDDNIPYDQFWQCSERQRFVSTLPKHGWVNVYRYFSDANIWPRGFPLEHVKDELPTHASLRTVISDCPIQQGLANDNPDVDAIYRMVGELPQSFRKDRRVALGEGSWCPFNSQNTTWWREAFPLLYLPSFCSFRMTDIWRSFVAQRIAWTNNWSVLFHEPTVWQARNEHNLLRDFRDEVPGYLHNVSIGAELEKLSLRSGVENLGENLLICYEALIKLEMIDLRELDLVKEWLEDLGKLESGFAEVSPPRDN